MIMNTEAKNPYSTKTPWPCMRGNCLNSGCLDLNDWRVQFSKLNQSDSFHNSLIHFHTNNSVFSTPIIDENERIFVGSGDHSFYAFEPHKSIELWHQTQSEIIDSAGCINSIGLIFMVGGDGKIRSFHPDGREIWTKNIALNRLKKQFTYSTLYWFEANIVLGPDNSLYAANDDFFLYKLNQNGDIIWFFRTGFLIWSAVGFLSDNTVILAGFDTNLYAIDSLTGRCKWKKNLNGSLVASPAIGNNDVIFEGSFNGKLYAIEGSRGRIKWEFDTGAHIYASCCISPDNIVYIGSSNGCFYALNSETGQVIWMKYFGEVIRSSASIGPDIENNCPYLIYVGIGDGSINALEPNGRIRWSYNTLQIASNSDYPNINASIALGWTGLCVASSTGDVIWIPYDYYLHNKEKSNYRQEIFNTVNTNGSWHYISPGGRLNVQSMQKTQEILPSSILSIKFLINGENGIHPAKILSTTMKIQFEPPITFNSNLQSDKSTVNIVSDDILNPNTDYLCKIFVEYNDEHKKILSNSQLLSLKTTASGGVFSIIDVQNNVLKIHQMAIPQPAILPSLNQIGFASLSIPFKIIYVDSNLGRFIALGIQKFGGEGAAMNRVSLYAFSGKYNNDYFIMESKNCLFEITAFNIPIRIFRIAGRLLPTGSVAPNASLLIEQKIGRSLIPLLSQMGQSSPINNKVIRSYIKSYGLKQILSAGLPFIRALIHQIKIKTWRMRGLINSEGVLQGVGTFQLDYAPRMEPINTNEYKIVKFGYVAKKKIIIADLSLNNSLIGLNKSISIILVDLSSITVVPYNYNNAISSTRRENQSIVTLKLKYLKDLKLLIHNPLRAFLLIDFDVIATFDFEY
jgi:outer membrane protein assembly factor BamB